MSGDSIWDSFLKTIDESKQDNIWETKAYYTAEQRRLDKKKRKEVMRHYQKQYSIEKKLKETK